MPGKHITDQQAKLYMNDRRTHTREAAAAKAGFSTSTGARLDVDPRLPTQKRGGQVMRGCKGEGGTWNPGKDGNTDWPGWDVRRD